MPSNNKSFTNKLGVAQDPNWNGGGYQVGMDEPVMVCDFVTGISQTTLYHVAAVGTQSVFYPAIELDYPQRVKMTTNTALTVPTVYELAGTDARGRAVSEQLTITIAGTKVASNYAYKTIDTVTVVSKTGDPELQLETCGQFPLRWPVTGGNWFPSAPYMFPIASAIDDGGSVFEASPTYTYNSTSGVVFCDISGDLSADTDDITIVYLVDPIALVTSY